MIGVIAMIIGGIALYSKIYLHYKYLKVSQATVDNIFKIFSPVIERNKELEENNDQLKKLGDKAKIALITFYVSFVIYLIFVYS